MKLVLLFLLSCVGCFAQAETIYPYTYLMPPNHPAKRALDTIFSSTYVLASPQTLKKAGFYLRTSPDPRQLVVAKHPFLSGYVIKAYLDTHQEIGEEWKFFVDRIIGADLIQLTIHDYGFSHLMKVPRKWIYPLPNPGRRKYVLVAEDMHLVTPRQNGKNYRKKITHEHLDALYLVLIENMLIDSVYIDNIPFCTDGKIAFIDTEHFHTTVKPLHLEKLLPHFSKEMQDYWHQLIHRESK